MTIKGSGQLSIAEINGEFGRGNDLNAYRNVQWWTDGGGSGNFSSGQISMAEFYGKRASSPRPPTIELLIVAGGGCGGQGGRGVGSTGGGGAGGMITTTINSFSGSISVGVGYGGTLDNGRRGGDSWFGDIRAYGGGCGPDPYNGVAPSWGGSGGGAGAGYLTGGAGVAGQGNAGGNNLGSQNSYYSCGGGGAGGPGGNMLVQRGYPIVLSYPGPGRYSDILGYGVTFATGGEPTPLTSGYYRDGTDGRGEGGSGGSVYTIIYSGVRNGRGGSGIVVARYTGPQCYSGGNEIYGWNGYTIHVFYNNGSLTSF